MLDTVRHSIRGLRRTPALALAAILCIGLGAAATTTVATLVSATLIRPVPFPDGNRLMRIWFEEPGVRPRISLSIPELDDFAGMQAFDAFLGVARVRTSVVVGAGTERMRGEAVSRRYFQVLGIRPAAGRFFENDDHLAGAPPVVVLSYGTWMRHFGGSSTAIGSTLHTTATTYTIVGVAQRGFDGTVEDDIVELFLPLERYEPRALVTDRQSRPSWVIGRLRPDGTLADAQAEAAGVAQVLEAAYPAIYQRWNVRVEPFGESWRQGMRGGSRLLSAASLVVLLVAAMNVGCLLVARVLDRRRELAVRVALGAGTRQLGLQLFIEAFLLVAAGGALGALTGPWLLRIFMAAAPPGHLTLPRYVTLEPDLVTLTISTLALMTAGLLAGVVPAFMASRVPLTGSLKDSGRGTVGSGSGPRWSARLIAAEAALTLVLLVAGGLLIRSYAQLSNIDVGFARDRIARLAVTLSTTDAGDPSRWPAMYERLQRELSSVPNVERIGLVHPTLPPYDPYRSRVRLDGIDLAQAPDGLEVGTHLVNESLLDMLGVPILAGRSIASSDATHTARVVVISRSLALLFGGPEHAIGRTLTFTRGATISSGQFQVVGVAENVAYDGFGAEDTRQFIRGQGGDLRAGRYDVYAPLAQLPEPVVSIGARVTGDPGRAIEPLRRRIADIAPTSPVHWTGAMADEIALEYAPTRFYTLLVAAFSSSALALTSIGVFALLSHAASRRTSEMGLRIALGASGSSAAALLVKDGLRPILIGTLIGLMSAAVVGRAMRALLYGVGALDAATFGASVAALIVVAVIAAAIPARRVATVDPLLALRRE